jgi:hypothetical protein
MNPKKSKPTPNPRILMLPNNGSVIANPNDPGAELIADFKLTSETIEWMVEEVKRRRHLNHHEAAEALLERLGPQATTGLLIMVVNEHDDRDGSILEAYRFTPSVLQAFRERTGNTVRWGKKIGIGSQSRRNH